MQPPRTTVNIFRDAAKQDDEFRKMLEEDLKILFDDSRREETKVNSTIVNAS
jgi:hypothetical protein